ncbi:PocR ligand-binding domain-containing protein [Oscillochloris sp. ZM17-4]|uniref:PocR ligand-binding domain-containing protein n=1 Tax=Oscillochloris sp. ZM17-4 TaxID=2866714 RepID=UPI0021039915|nr:PocR ligand-binding domain-containing protein [Oscillochloris sp. ZM17-4]
MTAREVQDILKVDRTTVYRMLKDGRITGVKVGQQWRFSRASVSTILSGSSSPEPQLPLRPADVLPLHCIQPIQDVFAEVAGLGAITIAPDGTPLTTPSGSCAFCALIQTSPQGKLACQESCCPLAQAAPGTISTCHAGLSYAHAPIRVEGVTVALLIAGQFHAGQPESTHTAAQLRQLSDSYGLDPGALAEAAASIPSLSPRARAQITSWLARVAGTFETIAHERATLLGRLRRIAEMTILEKY